MATEFIDTARCDPGYREGRTADFMEVEQRLDASAIKEQASRCIGCGIPFCHGAGCPLENLIPEFNRAVREGRMRDAYLILSETSPFPEFTSRVCPALCEASCCAGLPSDAVTIRQIEYAIIENAFAMGYVEPVIPAVRTGMRVAVIGSGPSGLSAAEELNRRGHEVVVFERNVNFGGLLRYGIPDFKLGKSVVERRLDVMRRSGIQFEGGVEIGSDISAEYLRKKFDAVAVCVGTQVPRGLHPGIPGNSLLGVHFAMDFLSSQNRVISGESSELSISAKDKKVLVIGGGDTGSDCVGTSIRQGALCVTQVEIMPEPPEERHASTPWPDWPYKKRTSSSHMEGCTRLWGVNVKRLDGRTGRVRNATFAHCDWEFDSLGRPKSFKDRPGSEFKIEADLVLLSMGFTGVEKSGLVEQLGIQLGPRSMLSVDGSFATNMEGVFAGGDAVNGPSLVVRALKSGKDMAACIDKHLKKIIRH